MADDGYSPVNTPEGTFDQALFHPEPDAMGRGYRDELMAWFESHWSLFVRGGDGECRRDMELPGVDRHCPLMPALQEHVLASLPEACEACGVEPFEVHGFEMNAVLFHDGDRFQWHTDHFQSSRCLREETKQITFMLYTHSIPKAFTGGELEFFDGTRVEPDDGLLLWINPYQRHRVVEVECPVDDPMAGRWSIAGWVHSRPTGARPDWHMAPGAPQPVEWGP